MKYRAFFIKMSEKVLENLKTKTCESCGKDFSCGADAKKCWCFEIDLNAETLAKLQEEFKSCLCPDCLAKREIKSVETNNLA